MNNFTKVQKQTRAYKFPTGNDLVVTAITAVLIDGDGSHVLLDEEKSVTVVKNDFQAYRMLFDEEISIKEEGDVVVEDEPTESETPVKNIKESKKSKK